MLAVAAQVLMIWSVQMVAELSDFLNNAVLHVV